MQRPLDLRLLAVRTDLADVSLKHQFFAPRYAEPATAMCAAPFAPLCSSPGGELTSELLQGERFMLLDTEGGWVWGWCAHDHYVGYIQVAALGEATPFNAVPARDFVEAAYRFLDMPYFLSGRGGAGIDCSGLVQRSLASIGYPAPRDSDMQRELGTPIGADEPLKRGDLIGFPGHIAIMIDPVTLIHATGHWGRVLLEPLQDVAGRTPVISRRRLHTIRSSENSSDLNSKRE